MEWNSCNGVFLFLLQLIFIFQSGARSLRYRFTSVSMNYGFIYTPKVTNKPKLILISGCTGTGKSTFGMTVALNQGILKCISTDSVRQVLRSQSEDNSVSPTALHRSSYSGQGDPITEWKECCEVLDKSVKSLVMDAMNRGVSLVLEGVHIVPSNDLIDQWRSSGGEAVGCLLVINDAEAHRDLIFKRGEITKKGSEKQQLAFHRIRKIQQEMIDLARANQWIIIEQQLGPNPMDIVGSQLS